MTMLKNTYRLAKFINVVSLSVLWRNGMCGLKDHDCKARMEARQGREGATR
jgi:hypothetical protein